MSAKKQKHTNEPPTGRSCRLSFYDHLSLILWGSSSILIGLESAQSGFPKHLHKFMNSLTTFFSDVMDIRGGGWSTPNTTARASLFELKKVLLYELLFF